MATTKPLEVHPEALEELSSALSWYLEHSQTAAVRFAAEVEQAIGLVSE
jgi:hypothetical protein